MTRLYDHVDAFIDDPASDNYAAFVLSYFRMPAFQQARFREFMHRHRLFCTHQHVRYRVTGCSRLGDVWLAKSHEQSVSYDLRVDINACSGWRSYP